MTVIAQYVNRGVVWQLPPCDECGSPATDGRHSSASPDQPCRDGFPAGPSGCANPELHHLYRLPADYLATEPVPDDELPDWAL